MYRYFIFTGPAKKTVFTDDEKLYEHEATYGDSRTFHYARWTTMEDMPWIHGIDFDADDDIPFSVYEAEPLDISGALHIDEQSRFGDKEEWKKFINVAQVFFLGKVVDYFSDHDIYLDYPMGHLLLADTAEGATSRGWTHKAAEDLRLIARTGREEDFLNALKPFPKFHTDIYLHLRDGILAAAEQGGIVVFEENHDLNN